MRTILAAGLFAAAAAVSATAPAEAACFYNKSEASRIRVTLNCGIFCSNEWNIPKGDYNCRGGKGGTVKMLTPDGSGVVLTLPVHDHGYVTITGSCETGFTGQSWTEKHQLYSEASFHNVVPGCR